MNRGVEIARGVVLLARFRPEGIGRFGASSGDVLGSLAPLLAFPLVAAVIVLLSGGGAGGGGELAQLLSLVDALLLQLVLSEALARRWQREAEWARYATALNWSQWAVPPVALMAALALGVIVGVGVSPALAAPVAGLGIVAYALALQWFVARHGLAIGRWRAAAMVLAVNLGNLVLVLVPVGLRAVVA